MSKESRTIELSAPQILGGALAAASAAVASSWLGVAGTVLGAVVVSVVATVGTALYTHSLERSSKVLRQTLPIERATGRPLHRPRPRGATAAGAPPSRSRPRWPALAVSAAATCVLGLALLTSFEALVGKPASTLTGSSGGGGTTVSRLVGEASPDSAVDTPRPDGEAATPRSTTPEPDPATPSSPEVPAATPTSGATPTPPATPTGGATPAPPAATAPTPPTAQPAPLVEPSQMAP